MSKILSEAEFAEADMFNETYECPYLSNLAVFDDTAMEWAVVSRVRMDKEGTKAYALALKKTFQNCEEDHPELDQVVHLWELLRIGVMQKSQD